MLTVEEINSMSEEEIALMNKKLFRRLVVTKFVIPIVVAAVVHVGVNILVNKLEKNSESN
jgi:hypothetical protein